MVELEMSISGKPINLKERSGEFGNTPIIDAIISNNKILAKEYINQADLEALNMADLQPQCLNTPLILAIKMGWEDIAIDLIKKGVNIHLTAADGFTALHYACLTRQDAVITALLAKGAKPDLQTEFKATARDYYLYNFSSLDNEGSYRIMQGTRPILQHGHPPLADIRHIIHYPSNFPHQKPLNQKIIKALGSKEELSENFRKRLEETRKKMINHQLDVILSWGPCSKLQSELQVEFDEIFSKKYNDLLERFGASYPIKLLKEEALSVAKEELIQKKLHDLRNLKESKDSFKLKR